MLFRITNILRIKLGLLIETDFNPGQEKLKGFEKLKNVVRQTKIKKDCRYPPIMSGRTVTMVGKITMITSATISSRKNGIAA